MEKTIEMLTEYILERCTALETENRRLTHQVEKLTEQNDHLLDDYARQADKLSKLARLIKGGTNRDKDGKVDGIGIYNKLCLGEICHILRIENDDKATA